MNERLRHLLCARDSHPALLGVLVLLCAGLGSLQEIPAEASQGAALKILVFTRTEGFTHDSITDGVLMIESIAAELGASVTETDQTTLFTAEDLANFNVVVWLSTTGDVLDQPEQDAFRSYIESGGGYVGIHAAADCEYGWPWYGELLGNGAWFSDHPAIQSAVLERDSDGPPDSGFPEAETSFVDEWYNFRANPRPVVRVLLTLDESSYDPGGGAMGPDHPITWVHELDDGRAFYTGLGHRSQTYQDSRFRTQIRNAILWAARAENEIFSDGFESGTTEAWETTPWPTAGVEHRRAGKRSPT